MSGINSCQILATFRREPILDRVIPGLFFFALYLYIVPQDILHHYTFDGRIELLPVYFYGDSNNFKSSKLQEIHETKMAEIWDRQNIELTREHIRKDIMTGAYGIEVVRNMTRLIKEHMIEQVFIYISLWDEGQKLNVFVCRILKPDFSM